MLTVATLVVAFLLGAIPFGLLIARLFGVADIRKHGSGNIGATNVYRVLGAKAAVWVFAADIGKGVAAVLLAKYVVSNLELPWLPADIYLVLSATIVILGHIFTPFLRFKGGKGVNTMLGSLITLLPIECLIALGVFLLIFLPFRMVSLASILATCSLFFILLVEAKMFDNPVASVYYYVAAGLAILVIITHRANISRILSGTENRIKFRSQS